MKAKFSNHPEQGPKDKDRLYMVYSRVFFTGHEALDDDSVALCTTEILLDSDIEHNSNFTEIL